MLGSNLRAMHSIPTYCRRAIAAITFVWWLPMAFAFANAQDSFTDHVTRVTDGQGRVSIEQDPEIERLVNGGSRTPATSARTDTTSLASPADTTMADQHMTGRRVRVNGYRIQVYAGGNNRKSKTEAYHVAGLVHTYFDDVPVYTHFVSPRWICRVGDCRTMEEATELMQRLRETGQFPEATIVKTKIIIFL
ncbi:MAG: SPOR domain-containing protein [Bacteroidaceae bacterium]|nr:SPOR domain-containing protein [Bacteroidaceae bacterium]